MACRYVLSSQYRPEVSPPERTHKVIAIVNKMVSMMDGVIQVSPRGLKASPPVSHFFNVSDWVPYLTLS